MTEQHVYRQEAGSPYAPTGFYENLWVGLLRDHQPTISDEGLVLGLVLFRYSLVNDNIAQAAETVLRLEAPFRSRPIALAHLFDLAPGWPGSIEELVGTAVRMSF